MVTAENIKTCRIGLFSVGLDTYWEQFPGLKARLTGYNTKIADQLTGLGVDVRNAGIIDGSEKAVLAGHWLRRDDVDMIFLHVATYALSASILPVIRRSRVPVVVLNLSPAAAIDYDSFNQMASRSEMTAEWLAHCQACSIPEISNVFSRCGIPFHQINGLLQDDPVAWTEIAEWVTACRVTYAMEHNRLGVMGHYYSGMLDIYSDLTLQTHIFGSHIEVIEFDEISSLRREATDRQVSAKLAEILQAFDVQQDCSMEQLETSARTSVALDMLTERHRLGSLAYYYKGTGIEENERSASSMIVAASLLTARGIPVAGEFEIKNVQAMKILDLMGVGGSFTEYYAMDYLDDVLLMGHDGPGHIAIANGKPKLKPLTLYHGKVGKGVSIEMSVRHGKVTLLSVAETGRGQLKLVVAEGESVAGPILEIGNTNSRYRFSLRAREFLREWNAQGAAHHCAAGVGHHANTLRKIAAILGIECIQVC